MMNFNDKEIIERFNCSCAYQGHNLDVEVEKNGEITFYFFMVGKSFLLYRIKQAWKFLIGKEVETVDFCLNKRDIKRFIEVLQIAVGAWAKDSAVCGNVADTLGMIGSDKAVESLVQVLTTAENSYVRMSAAHALGIIGNDKAVEPLIKVLTTDKKSGVRGSAAHALGKIGSDKAIASLIKALEDKGSYYGRKVSDVVSEALEEISRKNKRII